MKNVIMKLRAVHNFGGISIFVTIKNKFRHRKNFKHNLKITKKIPEKPQKENYNCTMCKYLCSSKFNMTRHYNRKHLNLKTWVILKNFLT